VLYNKGCGYFRIPTHMPHTCHTHATHTRAQSAAVCAHVEPLVRVSSSVCACLAPYTRQGLRQRRRTASEQTQAWRFEADSVDGQELFLDFLARSGGVRLNSRTTRSGGKAAELKSPGPDYF